VVKQNNKSTPNAIKRGDTVEILKGKDFLGANLRGKKAQIINPWVSKGVVCLRVDGEPADIFFARKDIKKIVEENEGISK
jgi:hypothetical protein